MPNEAHLTAIVPMRHTSERVVGKNYRPLGGRPLFHHIVSTLLSVPQIDEVAIDTDSPLIAEGHPMRRQVLYRVSRSAWAAGSPYKQESMRNLTDP